MFLVICNRYFLEPTLDISVGCSGPKTLLDMLADNNFEIVFMVAQ